MNNPEENISEIPDENIKEVSDDITENNIDDISEEVLDEIPDENIKEVSNDFIENNMNDITEEVLDGSSEEIPDENIKEVSNDIIENNIDDISEEVLDGSSEEIPDNFSIFDIDDRIINQLVDMEIFKPTDIQKEAIPIIMNRTDVLGVAPTGSGKTLAYLLPILDWIMNAKISHFDPTVLILVPTRELVRQIAEVIKILTNETQVFYASVFAGQNLNKLEKQLKEMNDILIATPGRLIAYINDGTISVKNLSTIVIDEVDRMMDMGFGPEIREILSHSPGKQKRQTLLFCATLPGQVEQAARELQFREQIVEIGRSQIPDIISHEVYETLNTSKFETLVSILKRKDMESVLIFTPSQENARTLAKQLIKLGLEVEELHSGLTQKQRNIALANFENGSVSVMVATDIGARGIDVDDISHVISYNVPKLFDDYVHRAGRTGRAGKKGISILIAIPREIKFIEKIEGRLKSQIPRKLRFPKKKYDNERSDRRSSDRRPSGDRRQSGRYGDRKPSGDRRSGDRRPSGDRRQSGRYVDRKPSGDRRSSDRRPSGDRRQSGRYGDRKPSGDRRSSDRRPSGDRKQSGRYGDRKPSGDRRSGDSRASGDRRQSGRYGDRKPSGDRRSSDSGASGDRRQSGRYGDRKPSGDRRSSDSRASGDRRQSGRYGDRKPSGDRRSSDRRPSGDRRQSGRYGDRKTSGDRRSSDNRASGDRRQSGRYGDRKPSGDRRSGDRRPSDDRRKSGGHGDRKPSGDRKQDKKKTKRD